MADIHIVWLEHSIDCETCGPSYAEGAKVTQDSELILNLEPHAHCFDGKSWDRDAVYRLILQELGHRLTEDHEPEQGDVGSANPEEN